MFVSLLDSVGTGMYYSIAGNEALIKFIKSKLQGGQVEILQHGYSHSPTEGGYRGEYGSNRKAEILSAESNLQYGRDIIGQILGVQPKFFVPPYDDISYGNIKMVIQKGFIPIYGQENIHRFFRSTYVPSVFKRIVAKRIIKKFAKSGFIIPVGISIQDQRIIMSLSSLGLKYEDIELFETLLDSLRNLVCPVSNTKYSGMPLCIINHYHQYFYDWSDTITRTEMFKVWQKLIDLLDSLTFGWKTTFGELYDRAIKIQRIRISKTGSKITIINDSKENSIEDFSFLVTGQLEPNASVALDRDRRIVTILHKLMPQFELILYER